ncbi:MAG: hypothetical protein R3F59_07980 [Myxococcota bacterium]
MRRFVTVAAALVLAGPAYAGGLGVLAMGGAHTEDVYFYSRVDADGNPFPSLEEYDQYKVSQTLPTIGAGLDLMLGDRDDRIVGDCRFYWMMDGAQKNPALDTNAVPNPQENVVAAYREESRQLGLALVGLSWGIVGNPDNFQLGAVGHIGSAFLTADHTEFLAFDLGPTVSYRFARQAQVFADVVYMGRYRKTFTHSGVGFVGVRYLFD